MRSLKWIFALIMTTGLAWAQSGVVSKVYEGNWIGKNPNEAKVRILEKATADITEEFVVRLIGEGKYKKNKSLIQSKILKQSGRYIPTVKTGNLQPEATGFAMSVEMQVLPSVLEQMLLEQGLLYDTEGNPVITPMIVFESEQGQNIWWIKNSDSQLLGFQTQFEKILQKRFFENGFFMERPASSHWGEVFPGQFKKSKLTAEEVQTLAPLLGSQIILVGKVKVESQSAGSYPVNITLEAIQASNGRLIAEVVRSISTDKGELVTMLSSRKFLANVDAILKEVSSQIFEAWQRGTFGSSVAEIQVLGKLAPNSQEGLKEALKTKSRMIRQIRERRIDQNGIVFEVDINGAMAQLAESLTELSHGVVKYKLKSQSAKLIVLEKL